VSSIQDQIATADQAAPSKGAPEIPAKAGIAPDVSGNSGLTHFATTTLMRRMKPGAIPIVALESRLHSNRATCRRNTAARNHVRISKSADVAPRTRYYEADDRGGSGRPNPFLGPHVLVRERRIES
jgi:hypothetical protein